MVYFPTNLPPFQLPQSIVYRYTDQSQLSVWDIELRLSNSIYQWILPTYPRKIPQTSPLNLHKQRNSQTDLVGEGSGVPSREALWVRSLSLRLNFIILINGEKHENLPEGGVTLQSGQSTSRPHEATPDPTPKWWLSEGILFSFSGILVKIISFGQNIHPTH